MKTLLVDDSGVTRKVILRSLNAVGLNDVVEAGDGREAFEIFQQDPSFDLVVTDWNMPHMTGLELAAAIRATGSKVAIFMVTTESDKATVLQALQAGVNDYLVKPFDGDALQAKLDRLRNFAAAGK